MGLSREHTVIMTLYSRAFGAFILPVLDQFKGTSISSALADLNKSQWWSSRYKVQVKEDFFVDTLIDGVEMWMGACFLDMVLPPN